MRTEDTWKHTPIEHDGQSCEDHHYDDLLAREDDAKETEARQHRGDHHWEPPDIKENQKGGETDIDQS